MIGRLVLVGLLGICGVIAGQAELTPWLQEALNELSVWYLGSGPEAPMELAESAQWVDRLAREIGRRLAEQGLTAVPAEDVAAFAMLNARMAGSRRTVAAEAPAEAVKATAADPAVEVNIEDIGKGQEGLRQGIEQLQDLPLSERFVVSGGINAALRAIRMPDASDMSSACGLGFSTAWGIETEGSLRPEPVLETYLVQLLLQAGARSR